MGNFDYIATRNDLIYGAFRIVGAIQKGQVLSAEMLQEGVNALQLIIKSWTNEHYFSWAFTSETFTTTASQETYDSTLDQGIVGLDKAWVVDSNDDLPLEVISYSRYLDIFDKTTNDGRPTVICYKPTPDPSFILWPQPDATYTIKALVLTSLQDQDVEDDANGMPVRWQRALKYALADDLFDEYPGTLGERQMVAIKAAALFKKAKGADMPQETNSEVESLFPRRG